MSIVIKDMILTAGEFKEDTTVKDTIVIHFTAGNNNPENTVQGWAADFTIDTATKVKKKLAVGTHFVIGGKSTRGTFDTTFDGKVYRAVPEDKWIHHLGTKYANNVTLNKKSFGIEVCNYGPIKKTAEGKFLNYVNSEVPADQVVALDKPYKGYSYYHDITDAQLNSLKELIVYLSTKYKTISLKTPLLDLTKYELSDNAAKGVPGVYVHTNYRKDKFDWPPLKKIADMLATICTKM
jgi:N-acetyl-anhydromuramyl-L-alanine amidase AmpD